MPVGETKQIVLFVHGGFAHAGAAERIGHYLSERGVATYSFDMQGFGHWEGKGCYLRRFQDYITDVDNFRTYIEGWEGSPISGIIGHSLGGLIAMSYVRDLREPLPVVVSSPWLRLANRIPTWKHNLALFMSEVYPDFGLPTGLKLHESTHDPSVLRMKYEDYLIGLRKPIARARWYIECIRAQTRMIARASGYIHPILILAAGDDRVTSTPKVEEVFHSLASVDKDWILYEDNFHDNFNELNREEVFADLWTWLGPRIGNTFELKHDLLAPVPVTLEEA